jgi:hypothetical protein
MTVVILISNSPPLRTAPPLPPRSGGEGSGVGGVSTHSLPEEQADRPPTPDPSPPRARARGGRGAHRACLRDLAARRARALPEISSPLLIRGRREYRLHAAPAVSCATVHKGNAHEHTGSAEAIRHSLRNGLRLITCSPVNGSFATVTPEKLASQELDTSTAMPGPHDFAVRLTRRSSKAHPRPPLPVPRLRRSRTPLE